MFLTCETILICISVVMEEEAEDLGKFFKNIVFGTKFDQTENCDYVAKIINYLNSMPVFSLLDFKDILDGLGREETDTKREIPMGKAKPQPTEPSYQKPQIEEAFGQPREAFGQKHSQQGSGGNCTGVEYADAADPAAGYKSAARGREEDVRDVSDDALQQRKQAEI